jgi:DNA-binding HxlR family transcriptional regulator
MRKLLLSARLSSRIAYDPHVPAETPLAAALERVGDRWSLLVVEALLPGPRRFNELQGEVAGIAPNILADRLRRLESERVVRSSRYSDRPPRFVYELTAEGQELAGALRLLADWGSRAARDAEPIRHAACGTPVEARWYCTTCDRPIAGEEAEELPRV